MYFGQRSAAKRWRLESEGSASGGLLCFLLWCLQRDLQRGDAERIRHLYDLVLQYSDSGDHPDPTCGNGMCSGHFLQVAPVKNSLFMILHALCNSILPYFFYTWSINRIEVGKVSIITAGGEPSAAMMFGLIFFGEWPSLLSFGGMVLTIFALSILCAPEKKLSMQGRIESGNSG